MKITCPHCGEQTERAGPFPAAFWTNVECNFCYDEFSYRLGETVKEVLPEDDMTARPKNG